MDWSMSKPVKTDVHDNRCGSELLCPECGGNNLHQTSASVFFRDFEDAPGTLVHSSGKKTEMHRMENSEMPGRRDHIDIEFCCENCHEPHAAKETFTLRIIQHKGITYMGWV